MEEVPILNLEQIQQLAEMVKGIQQDNRKDLDSILAESVDIQYTTIINLYNLTVQAWQNKQKIIDNMCHFTLTMMNTVQYLWEKQYEQEDKISNAEIVIGTLERNIGELNEQNKQFKSKVNEVEVQLNNVAGERDRIEELYRSASCIAFESEKQLKELGMGCKKCSACFESTSEMDQEQSELLLQKSQKIIEEKEEEILSLKSENRKLQEQFENLKEQHQLSKLQMELAEIAIKDALTYKESYISMMSQIQDSSAQTTLKYQNSMLRNCRSEPQQQFCPLNSHILSNELPTNQEPEDLLGLELNTMIHKEQDSQLSLIRLEKKEEKKTTYQTPFRKKKKNNLESQNEHEGSFDESAIYNRDSVVIFQSNIDFTISSNHESSKDMLPNQSKPSSRLFCSTIGRPTEINRPKSRNQGQRKSKPYVPSDRQLDESMSSQSSSTTINKLYNYISTKLISNRIRRH